MSYDLNKECERRRRQKARRAVWAATYAAAMVRQLWDRAAEGRGFAVDEKTLDGMASDAATAADLSMQAWERLSREEQGPP